MTSKVKCEIWQYVPPNSGPEPGWHKCSIFYPDNLQGALVIAAAFYKPKHIVELRIDEQETIVIRGKR